MKIQGLNPAVIAAYARSRTVSGSAVTPPHPPAVAPGQAAPTAAAASRTLEDLVAGTVSSGINRGEGFDQIPPRAFPRQTLQLYTNSAERVEAATRVAAGRILDTTA